MVLSLGNGSQENVTSDAASIYMLENQSIPIDATSTNVDSLNSTYEAPPETFESIAKKPQVDAPKVQPDSGTQVQEDIDTSLSDFINEKNSLPPQTGSIDFSDDPVFAALDEAQNEGLLTYNEESQAVAGTERDSETESQQEVNDVNAQEDLPPESVPPSDVGYKEINIQAEKDWRKGRTAVFRNKSGADLLLPRPDYSLTMKKSTRRTIKYLVIHTAGSSESTTPASLMRFFFNERDGGGWNTGGYHWIVGRKGKPVRVYSDDISTNGAKGINGNSIHLNWIGGYSGAGEPLNFNITNGQINTLKRLVRKYTDLYPDIKVLGHNQCSNKPCPLFNVPTWCEKINIAEGNIFRGILPTNKGFYAKWEGSDLINESNRLANLVT